MRDDLKERLEEWIDEYHISFEAAMALLDVLFEEND
jgi:hypothetical protein